MEAVKLKDALKVLETAVTNTLAHFDQLDRSNLPEILTSFAGLKECKEQLDIHQKLVSELYQQFSYEVVPNVLKANNLESAKSRGRLFTIATRVDASIPEDLRTTGYDWIKNVAKVPELIVPRVNPKQLSSFAKAYFEAHAEWPPENVMKVHLQEYIQVRRS